MIENHVNLNENGSLWQRRFIFLNRSIHTADSDMSKCVAAVQNNTVRFDALREWERERERLEPQCKSIFSDPYHPHLTMRSGHLQHLTSNWAYRMWWYCYASLPCVSSFDLVSCCLLPSFGFIFVWFPLFHVSSLFNAHTNISPAVYLDCINNKNDLGCLPPHARLNWRWILYSVRRSSFAIDTLQQQQNYSIIFVVSSPFIQIQCAPTDSRLFIPFRIPYAHSLCFSIFLLFFFDIIRLFTHYAEENRAFSFVSSISLKFVVFRFGWFDCKIIRVSLKVSCNFIIQVVHARRRTTKSRDVVGKKLMILCQFWSICVCICVRAFCFVFTFEKCLLGCCEKRNTVQAYLLWNQHISKVETVLNDIKTTLTGSIYAFYTGERSNLCLEQQKQFPAKVNSASTVKWKKTNSRPWMAISFVWSRLDGLDQYTIMSVVHRINWILIS